MYGWSLQKRLSLLVRSLVALLLLAGGAVSAEDETPPDPTTQPRAAEIMPLAARSILLGIATTESGFVAVGERGHILRSKSGKKWTQVNVPVRSMLTDVYFPDPRTGWAVGHDGVILKTTDAGRSWALKHFDASMQPFYDILFLSEEHGIAVGKRSQVVETLDGGETWELVENDVFDFMFHINQLVRLGDGTLLGVGERGLLARSTDDGVNWEMLKSPYVGSFFGALPNGDSGAIVFGMRGNIYATENVAALETEDLEVWDEYAAQTITDPEALAALGWKTIESGTDQSLFGGALLPDGSALLVGVNGVAVISTDGMQRFSPLPDPLPFSLNAVTFRDDRVIGVGMFGPVQIQR